MEKLVATRLARTVLFTILWSTLWMVPWLLVWQDNVDKGGWFIGIYSLPAPSLLYYFLDKVLSKHPIFASHFFIAVMLAALLFTAVFPIWLAVGTFMLQYPYGYLEYYVFGNPF